MCISGGCRPRSGASGSSELCGCSFIRFCQQISRVVIPIRQHVRVLFDPHPTDTGYFLSFYCNHPHGCEWYDTVVVILLSLLADEFGGTELWSPHHQAHRVPWSPLGSAAELACSPPCWGQPRGSGGGPVSQA